MPPKASYNLTPSGGNNVTRQAAATPLAVFTCTRPHAGPSEPVPHRENLSPWKLKAEGTPAEVQIVLGWTLDARALRTAPSPFCQVFSLGTGLEWYYKNRDSHPEATLISDWASKPRRLCRFTISTLPNSAPLPHRYWGRTKSDFPPQQRRTRRCQTLVDLPCESPHWHLAEQPNTTGTVSVSHLWLVPVWDGRIHLVRACLEIADPEVFYFIQWRHSEQTRHGSHDMASNQRLWRSWVEARTHTWPWRQHLSQ